MPIITNLRSFELKNQIRNGTDFVGASTEFATNFVGVVGELVRAEYQIDLSWYANATPGDSWEVEALAIERQIGSFIDDGFGVGQTFEYFADWATYNNSSEDFVGTITAITLNGTRLEFTVNSGTVTTGSSITIAGIQAQANLSTNMPDAAILRFNLLPNGQTFSNSSELTNTDQAWYAANIDLVGATEETMYPVGVNKDWQTGSATIQRSAANLIKNGATYTIVHLFRVNPFASPDYLNDLENGNTPSFWQQELNYYFQVEFRKGLNNTNSAKIVMPDRPAGQSSWYNQSPGGFYSRYNLATGPIYTDVSDSISVSSIQVDRRTETQFTLTRLGIPGSTGGFNPGDSAIIYISYIPELQSEYQQTPTTLEQNFVFDSIAAVDGLAPTTGTGIFKQAEVTVAGGVMTVTVETEYSSSEQLKIGASGNYLMWVMVSDTNLPINDTDRTPILVDVKSFTKTEFIPDLCTFTTFNTLTHPRELGTDTGLTPEESIAQWNEDGVLVDFEFSIDTSKSAKIEGITFILAAYKSADNTYFPLDSYNYNLSGQVVANGIQQFSLENSRGYLLAQGDQFNEVALNTGMAVGNNQGYTGNFAQKIKWQDWLFNNAVDTIFYDASEPQNNLNFKSDNYSGNNGYEIRLMAIVDLSGIDANGVAGVGRTTTLGSVLNIYDYNVSDGAWTGSLQTLDPDTLSDLGGKLRGDKDTLFRVTWNEGSTDLTRVYGIHRIQGFNSLGDDIEELSSLRDPGGSLNKILKPTAGNTLLNVYVSGSDIVSECLIDHTKLVAGKKYNLSARIDRYAAETSFTVAYVGCDMQITNTFSGPNPITNIEYQFTVNSIVVDTINTTDTVYTWNPSALYEGDVVTIQQTVTAGGTTVSSAMTTVVAAEICYFEYTSNLDGTDTFRAESSSSGDDPYWRLPDIIVRQSENLNLLGSDADFDGTNQIVTFVPDGGFGEITAIDIANSSVQGAVDFSNFTSCLQFRGNTNPGITAITFPPTTASVNLLYLGDCNVLGTLDLTPMQNLGGDMRIFRNSNLTQVSNPTSSSSWTLYQVSECNITGTLDLSPLSGLSGAVVVHSNSNMTQLTFPASSGLVTRIEAYNCDLTGVEDLSPLSNLSGEIRLYNNSNLTNVTFPVTSNVIDTLYVYACDITGTFNLSNLSNLAGDIRLFSNPNMTGISFPASSQAITFFQASETGLTTINLSSLTNMSDLIILHSCPNLTSITFPTSSNVIDRVEAYSCNLTGTLDLSPMSALEGEIEVRNNPLLTSITMPSSTGPIDDFDAGECNLGYFSILNATFASNIDFDIANNSMTTAEVNRMLVDMDTVFPATGTGTIQIAGTNGAPDATSGGFNGTAAVLSLSGKGYTVITS